MGHGSDECGEASESGGIAAFRRSAQRVWIAMALAQNTKLLFLDEPTTYLDIRYQIQILELVQKLNREFGITILMVLHDMNQAIYFSDRVIGLKDGRICMEGDPEEVVTADKIEEIYDIRLSVETINGRKFVLTANYSEPGL